MAEDITFILKARNEARRAAKQFNDDLKKSGTSAKKVADEARRAARETDKLGREADQAKKSFRGMAQQSDLLGRSIKTVARAAVGLVAGLATLGTLNFAINEARDFNAALSETSTLIEGTPEELGQLRDAAGGLVRQFGGRASDQISAFYQAISAGVTDLDDATDLLNQANKLAIGGVSEVTTGVDILTTAINAYGPEVLSAADASDSLFVAVRAGKTTVDELASSLGRAIPFANQAGVGFDELNAATAALTTQGINTREAVTGLRAIFAAVIKPTSEAAEEAKRLGLEFNTTALRSQGLAGFLEEVAAKTGGSEEAIAKLFGSVEALAPILSLAGRGGEIFADILVDMENKAGAADEAFGKVAASLSQRLNVALDRLIDVARRVGDVLLTIIVPAMEALASAAEFVADNIVEISVALGLLALPALPALIGGAASAFGLLATSIKLVNAAIRANPIVAIVSLAVAAINELLDITFMWQGETIRLGDVVTIVWENIKEGIGAVVGSIAEGVSNIVEYFTGMAADVNAIWLAISDALVAVLAGMIDFVAGFVAAVGVALNNIPVLFELAFVKAANLVIDIVNQLLFNLTEGLAKFFAGIDAVAGAVGLDSNLLSLIGTAPQLDPVSGSGAASELETAITDAFRSGAGTAAGIFNQAASNARIAAEDLAFAVPFPDTPGAPTAPGGPGGSSPLDPEGTGGSTGGSSGGSSTQEKASALADTINKLTGEWRMLAETAGMTEAELEEYNIRQELLNAAAKDGVTISEAQIQSLLDQKAAYEEVAAAQETFFVGARRGWEEFANSVQTNAEFAQDITRSFFEGTADLITQLVTEGTADWRGFLLDLLNQIASFLANQLVVQLFEGLFGSPADSGGGFLSGLLGGVFGRQHGGNINPSQPYLVGERGPELVVPRAAATVVPAQETAEMMRSGPTINMTVVAQDANSFRRSQSQIMADMQRGLMIADRRNN